MPGIFHADRTGLEIFANAGLVFTPVNINISADGRGLSMIAKGAKVLVNNLAVYELKSIW